MMGRAPKIMTPGEGVALKDLLTRSRINEGILANQPAAFQQQQEAHDMAQRTSLASIHETARERDLKNQQEIEKRVKEAIIGGYQVGLATVGDPAAKLQAARAYSAEQYEKLRRSGVWKNLGMSDAEYQQDLQDMAQTGWAEYEAAGLTPKESLALSGERKAYPAAADAQGGAVPLSQMQNDWMPPEGWTPQQQGMRDEWLGIPEESRRAANLSPEMVAMMEGVDVTDVQRRRLADMDGGVALNQIPEAAAAPEQKPTPRAAGSQLDRDLAAAQAQQDLGGKVNYEKAKDMRADAYRSEEARMKRAKVEDDARKERTRNAEHLDKLNKEKNDLENKMSKDFMKGSKVLVDTRDAYSRIRVSAQDPSAAGDLSMIFNYMKMLDPGSTVREGEFATAQNAAGVPERVRAFYANILRGERMTPPQRNDFLTRAEKIYDTIYANHRKFERQWRERADRAEVDPEDVIMDLTPAPLDDDDKLKIGDIETDGEGNRYEFLGGDPAKQKNWKELK
jgi:hypothetical protein